MSFRDILENNCLTVIVQIFQKTALLYEIQTVKELSPYVFPFWRYWNSSKKNKNALRHKNTHYVIVDAYLAYFVQNFFRTLLTIVVGVD